jgi:EAL domain-containing protein (putative c-di-GMP-specific phosphodiesterase class I)
VALAQILSWSDEALRSDLPTPVGIDHILRALRLHLGLDVAFASCVANGRVVIRNVDSEPGGPVSAGDAFAAEDGYCQRIIDGRIPYLIPDTSLVPEVARLACTSEIPVRSHISVPLRLSDGSVYGTFCCFGFRPDQSLNARDLDTLKAFAEIAAAQIEADLDGDAARAEIETRVRQVVERDNLTMVYQPVYRIADGAIVGVEALARFPDAASRSPDAWFAEAETVGLAAELELCAIRSALRALPYIPADVRLGVNVSPRTLLLPALRDVVEGVAPGRLVLEVTEHAVVRDYVELTRALEPLRRRVLIAIDDAGAGYSGLRHILDIRPDIIKLDLALTRGIDQDPPRAALASALVRFGVEIGAVIVAEGVETAAELKALEELHVQAAQGYFLQKPMPISAAQFLFHRAG